MIKRISVLVAMTATLLCSVGAFAYDFWGITVGTASYKGNDQLTFDGVGSSGSQYVVGGYKYTRVDGDWLGAFEAAIPGEGYLASSLSDAQGLFFSSTASEAKFVVFTTSTQTGVAVPELGYSKRLFGPGDLKLDIDGATYGVGMRVDDLLWAQDPKAKGAQYQLYSAAGGKLNMHARDEGTLGRVELDPTWGRVGNQTLASNSDKRFAFYVSGSGQYAGSANVDYVDTGLYVNGVNVYACEVTVPWETLGVSGDNLIFSASWRPDCGNDIITTDFVKSNMSPVPEPGTLVSMAGGLLGLAAFAKRR